MPWIIADDEGRICHARKKVYNTERGAKMGYRAALDNYLQCWYLYDDEDLDYNFYVSKTIPQDGSFLGNLLAKTNPPADIEKNEQRWGELTEQFNSMYSIQEVTMQLQVKS